MLGTALLQMQTQMKGNSMKYTIRTLVAGLLLAAHAAVANGEYTETMDPNALMKNLSTDFGLLDDLELRWFSKFFEGPSIGAVRDSTEGHYHVIVEHVTLDGFKYNNDKTILTPKDARPGKWWQTLDQWKSDRGISDE